MNKLWIKILLFREENKRVRLARKELMKQENRITSYDSVVGVNKGCRDVWSDMLDHELSGECRCFFDGSCPRDCVFYSRYKEWKASDKKLEKARWHRTAVLYGLFRTK